MTREEAIQEFQNVKDLIRQDGKDWFDERDLELIDMAIEALSEPINCVKCKHYYETEDDTDVHGHCKMDTAHTMKREEAITIIDNLHLIGCGRNQHEDDLKINVALDMAIEALSTEPNCKDCKKRNNTTFFMDDEEALDMAIEALSEPKRGKWKTVIRHEHYPSGKEYEADYCSVCGRRGSLEYNYCPCCGARTESE